MPWILLNSFRKTFPPIRPGKLRGISEDKNHTKYTLEFPGVLTPKSLV
jgi:hypothetical protein